MDQEGDSTAIFGQVGWQFLSAWSLTAGARYTEETRDFEGCQISSEQDTTPPPNLHDIMNVVSINQGGSGGAEKGDCVSLDPETRNPELHRDSLTEDNTSGRVSLDWTPRDDYLFFLSFSRGFKSGSFPQLPGVDARQFRPATQERLDVWELGGKLSFLSRKLQVNIAAFHYDYVDKQLRSFILDPVFGPLAQLTNIPESQVVGGEMEVQTMPLRNLEVRLSATYLDTEVIEFTGTNANGEEKNFSGNGFPFSPSWTGTLSVNYRWGLPFIETLEMGIGANYSYTDETNSVLGEDPRFALRSYPNVDYRVDIGHVDQSWEFAIWGRNVTNEYQPVNTVRPGGSDVIARYAQKPQTYGVSFKYHYH